MADPAVIEIPEWTWVKVATATRGVHINRKNTNVEYWRTYRLTGEAAPSNLSIGDPIPTEAIRMFELSAEEFVKSSEAIDVYVLAKNNDADSGDSGYVVVGPVLESVDVAIQDQSTEIVDLYLFRQDGIFTLSAPVTMDAVSFQSPQAGSMSAGMIVCFQEGTHFMQASVLSVSAPTVNIDTPFDFAFTTSGGCSYGVKNMAVDGSVTTQIFRVSPKNLQNGVKWDITRIIFAITDDAAMDDGKFGGIAALTKGIILRVKDGDVKNIFNAKTNGDFAERMYDVTYVPATLGPSGLYGLRGRRSFNGLDKNGVVIRLSAETDDEFQVLIRDNLSTLSGFEMVVQGHVVSP